MVAKLSLSCRQVVAKLSPCVSDSTAGQRHFFGSYRRLPTSRLNCSSRQIVARVCCFLRFCIKPMRYIYHPHLDCYLVAVNSDCSRPCELTLSYGPIFCLESEKIDGTYQRYNHYLKKKLNFTFF